MSPGPITENTLFYGDNLDILRQYLLDESVDLIYLDPPFNSSRNYNILFKDEGGIESEAQITAFEDTWHWNHVAEETYHNLITQSPDHIATMIEALRKFVGSNQMMAYLVMMSARLVELHRVLKPTGSLYLHCDPTSSHYLKIILDTLFDPRNFHNEIVWKRKSGRGEADQKSKEFGQQHDTILFYSKTDDNLFHTLHSFENAGEYIEERFKYVDENGRRYRKSPLTSPSYRPNLIYEYKGYQPPEKGWAVSRETMEQMERDGRLIFPKDKTKRIERKAYLDEYKGQPIQSIWTDIPFINPMAQERLGYPTQKPLALLERIIQASSNPDTVILDPFCGCGTAIAAAQKLGRKWIGIDITHLSIALQKYRMEAMFPGIKFKVVGEPKDIGAARQLASEDRYQFQWWSLSLIRARPLGGQGGSREGKKGSDKGIDGVIAFIDDSTGKAKRVIVQVKSGHVNSSHIRDLKGTLQREQAALGVFITLEPPSKDMTTEAVSSGFYYSPGWNQQYPRIQILTIEELLHGSEVKMPPQFGTFKQAQRVQQSDAEQAELDLSTG